MSSSRSDIATQETTSKPAADLPVRQPSGWSAYDWIGLGLLAVAILWAIRLLWKPGVPNDIDLMMSTYRVFELSNSAKAGVFYPRLGPDLNFGYGAPLFQFYPPLVSYLIYIVYLLGTGFVSATKFVLMLNLTLSGLGTFCYIRWLTKMSVPALCSALLYLFSPYILTVTYERGAAAETMALALLPWLLWALHRLVNNAQAWDVALAALFTALLMLAHNITALFVIPAVLLYCALLCLYNKRWQQILPIAVAIALGLGLSAFYWLPAITELDYTRAREIMLAGSSRPEERLLPVANVVQTSLAALYAGDERFRFGLFATLLGVFALLALMFGLYRREHRFMALLLLIAWLVVLAMQTNSSRLIWENVSVIRFIQFPWRLFGPASLCLAIAVGLFFAANWWQRVSGTVHWLSTIALGLAVGFLATQNLHIENLPLWKEITNEQVTKLNLFERGRIGYALFSDYTPKWMQLKSSEISVPRAPTETAFPALPTLPAIQVLRESQQSIDLKVTSGEAFALRYHRLYFPGWQIYVDGNPVPTTGNGSLGVVSGQIPAGEHAVRILFEQTPIRRLADLLSWLSLLATLGAFGWFTVAGIRWVGLAGIVIVSVGFWLASSQIKANTSYQPQAYAANLGNIVLLTGYHLEQSELHPGDTANVRLYWFANQTSTVNYKVFFHLVKPDDSGLVAQVDHEPTYGYNPVSRWEPGELVADDYRIPIDPSTPTGEYLVVVGMYDPTIVQNIPVVTAPNLLPGDRIVLTTIKIVQ